MNLNEAKAALDKVINKGRVHMYKPIQIAEVLRRDRVSRDIDLANKNTYRAQSKGWRDIVSLQLVGRVSTSSARYQDNVFEANACPPDALVSLGEVNRSTNGIVEAYVYHRFGERYKQLTDALDYITGNTHLDFHVPKLVNLFWEQPGLKRSIDKVFEILVYSLFVVIVDELEVKIEVSMNEDKLAVLEEFEDFARAVICIDKSNPRYVSPAHIYRVGVCNAADRGLDMWANFGPAVQVKHVSLTGPLAAEICSAVTSDRIVVVCKDASRDQIVAVLAQVGLQGRIQSVIVESDLFAWYEKALRGTYSDQLGKVLMTTLADEFMQEFPSSQIENFKTFINERGYVEPDEYWRVEHA